MSRSDHDEVLASIDTRLAVIETHCTDRCIKVNKHDETLYGNGRWGLVAKVRAMWWLLGIVTGIITIAIGEWLATLASLARAGG